MKTHDSNNGADTASTTPYIPESGPGQLWRKLKEAPAQVETWVALARLYAEAGLVWQGGYAARQALRLDRALAPHLDNLKLDDWRSDFAGAALLGRPTLPDAADLIADFTEVVRRYPNDWLSWLYLARLHEMNSDGSEESRHLAEESLEHARVLEPLEGESLHWMGLWRFNAGNPQGAVAAFSRLLDIRPVRFGSMMHLGEALLHVGNAPAAEKAFSRAALSRNPVFLQTLAQRVYSHNYWQEAIAILRIAAELSPGNVELLLSLAQIQSEVYTLDDCAATLDEILQIAPDNREAGLLKAGLLGRTGDAHAHLSILRQAYEAGGDPLSRMASSILMSLLYQDELSAEHVAEQHRALCAPIETALAARNNFANDRTPERRLRIGYLTGDLHRQHPVNVFMLPVLLRHNHADFEICIYHTGTMNDEYTRRARASADRWLEAAKLDDNQLRDAVAADQVDILVDLAGHTSSHRLGVMALRGAPVQATFLGYPHSTGLTRIDWLIGDRIVSPAEHSHLFSEGIAQMPDCVWCWATVDEYPLPAPRPAEAPLVFGSFNNAMKLSPRTVALWARVLKAVPDARLLLKAPSLRDESIRRRFAGLFAEQGIGAERLIMRGPTGLAEMMQEYGDVDIALDPLPYNGGTTTMQALWMGVPAVTLVGDNFVGRMGASFMTTLGTPELAAANEEQYVAAAVRLAEQRAALRGGRAALRRRMTDSPLCDIATYVSNFEALLREMWRSHCRGDGARLLRVES